VQRVAAGVPELVSRTGRCEEPLARQCHADPAVALEARHAPPDRDLRLLAGVYSLRLPGMVGRQEALDLEPLAATLAGRSPHHDAFPRDRVGDRISAPQYDHHHLVWPERQG
jgi:hypothetical protein